MLQGCAPCKLAAMKIWFGSLKMWRGLGVSVGALTCLVAACGQESSNATDAPAGTGDASADGSAVRTEAGVPLGDAGAPAGFFDACGGRIVDKVTGSIDPAEYRRQATLWDRATIDCRLGPKFTDLHPGVADDRPTAYQPPTAHDDKRYGGQDYQLGTIDVNCHPPQCDYGSTVGQVFYAPDDPSDPGMDRVQTYDYEFATIAESPQQGGWLGGAPHPDPAVPIWEAALGRKVQGPPVGIGRTEYVETGDGIVAFVDGVVGTAGTQTSGSTNPYLVLPKNKVPTAVAVTSYAEFALVTVWDTEALKGQIAVIITRATKPGAFSIPYYGMPNEGGYVSLQLLGFVDLPDMATPTSIATSGNNGTLPGGHVIGFELSDFVTNAAQRDVLRNDTDQERVLSSSGSAVVLSQWENKATFVDLRPLFQFVRNVYLTTPELLQQAANQTTWPFDFASHPEAMPVVVKTVALAQPKVARVGNTGKPLRAWIAQLDGTLSVFDISAINAAARPVPADSIDVLGTVQVGANPTALHVWPGVYSHNDGAVLSTRGDRSVEWIDATKDGLVRSRVLRDSRMNDPVDVDICDRANMVTVAEFTGKKIISYRFGKTEDNSAKKPDNYGCGPNGSDADCTSYECGGELAFPGTVFRIDTANVN